MGGMLRLRGNRPDVGVRRWLPVVLQARASLPGGVDFVANRSGLDLVSERGPNRGADIDRRMVAAGRNRRISYRRRKAFLHARGVRDRRRQPAIADLQPDRDQTASLARRESGRDVSGTDADAAADRDADPNRRRRLRLSLSAQGGRRRRGAVVLSKASRGIPRQSLVVSDSAG